MGEIDVRYSFDDAVKAIDHKPPRIETPKDDYITEQSFMFQKVSFRNQEISSKSSKMRLSLNHNNSFQPNETYNFSISPSRQGKRLLNNNPVYQNKYVISNRSEIKHKIQKFIEEKSIYFPSLREIKEKSNKISINLRRSLVKTRLNRSHERTTKLKSNHMNIACMFNQSIKFNDQK